MWLFEEKEDLHFKFSQVLQLYYDSQTTNDNLCDTQLLIS